MSRTRSASAARTLRRLVAEPQQQLLVERRRCSDARRLCPCSELQPRQSVCWPASPEPRCVPSACDAGTPHAAREIPYTVRRSTRARRVRVNVHAHTRRGGRAAGARARARGRGRGQRAAPLDRAPPGEAREVLARVAARAGTVPYLGATLELVPQAGRTRVHRARGSPARARRRRASGARALLPPRARAPRSPRDWTARRRARGQRLQRRWTSARSARAGRRARRAGA